MDNAPDQALPSIPMIRGPKVTGVIFKPFDHPTFERELPMFRRGRS